MWPTVVSHHFLCHWSNPLENTPGDPCEPEPSISGQTERPRAADCCGLIAPRSAHVVGKCVSGCCCSKVLSAWSSESKCESAALMRKIIQAKRSGATGNVLLWLFTISDKRAERGDFFQGWTPPALHLLSSSSHHSWVSVWFSLQLCHWLVTVTRCSVWSLFLSAMNPCNHGRGPALYNEHLLRGMCTHTHTHNLSDTHSYPPTPWVIELIMFWTLLSLFRCSSHETRKWWHTLMHKVHKYTDLVSWPRMRGVIRGSKSNLVRLGMISVLAWTMHRARKITQIHTASNIHAKQHV